MDSSKLMMLFHMLISSRSRASRWGGSMCNSCSRNRTSPCRMFSMPRCQGCSGLWGRILLNLWIWPMQAIPRAWDPEVQTWTMMIWLILMMNIALRKYKTPPRRRGRRWAISLKSIGLLWSESASWVLLTSQPMNQTWALTATREAVFLQSLLRLWIKGLSEQTLWRIMKIQACSRLRHL